MIVIPIGTPKRMIMYGPSCGCVESTIFDTA